MRWNPQAVSLQGFVLRSMERRARRSGQNPDAVWDDPRVVELLIRWAARRLNPYDPQMTRPLEAWINAPWAAMSVAQIRRSLPQPAADAVTQALRKEAILLPCESSPSPEKKVMYLGQSATAVSPDGRLTCEL